MIAKSMLIVERPKLISISFSHFISVCSSIFSIMPTPETIVHAEKNTMSIDLFRIALNSSLGNVLLLSDR